MNRITQPDPSVSTVSQTARMTVAFSRLMSAMFGISLVLVASNLVLHRQLPGETGWPEAILVFTTAIATLVSLSRQLPGQNVILAAAVIAFIGGIAHALSTVTAIPFGPLRFTASSGPKILGLVSWAMPAIWIIAVLNSRGVARLILRPWRSLPTYGFWLMGISAVISVLFAMALDPFASQIKRYWLWQPTKFALTWHGAPLVNYLGWLVIAMLILAFATPSLINKLPRTISPAPDYHPLAAWLLPMALFALGATLHQLWTAAAFCLGSGALVTGLAIRGARW